MSDTPTPPTCRGCEYRTSDSAGEAVWSVCTHPDCGELDEWGDGNRTQDEGGTWHAPCIPAWCPLPEGERPGAEAGP